MIPIRDNIPSRTTPFIGYGMIVACALVFLAQLNEEQDGNSLVARFGMIPARVIHPDRTYEIPVGYRQTREGIEIIKETAAEPPVPAWLTPLTCVFLHGGWLHIIGNMWFLYIFGDNVEDRFGHLGFLLFYLGCGVAASLTHLVIDPDATTPTIGASGAIAGVMGAYFVLYPKAKVLSVVPIFFFLHLVVLPAPLYLGIWFLIQFFQGAAAVTTAETGGVAWWAHIGGFVVGVVLAFVLDKARLLKPRVQQVRPNTEHSGFYRLPPRRRF